MSTSPKDMDPSVPIESSITILFSTTMHRGPGSVLMQSQDSTIVDNTLMKTSCLNHECSISFISALQPSTYYDVEFSRDFFVNEYNIPLQHPLHLLFKTSTHDCGVQSIQEGLGDSHLCSCFSDHDACICNCGDVQMNRVF